MWTDGALAVTLFALVAQADSECAGLNPTDCGETQGCDYVLEHERCTAVPCGNMSVDNCTEVYRCELGAFEQGCQDKVSSCPLLGDLEICGEFYHCQRHDDTGACTDRMCENVTVSDCAAVPRQRCVVLHTNASGDGGNETCVDIRSQACDTLDSQTCETRAWCEVDGEHCRNMACVNISTAACNDAPFGRCGLSDSLQECKRTIDIDHLTADTIKELMTEVGQQSSGLQGESPEQEAGVGILLALLAGTLVLLLLPTGVILLLRRGKKTEGESPAHTPLGNISSRVDCSAVWEGNWAQERNAAAGTCVTQQMQDPLLARVS
eukprot:TRINITY_DN12284_c0_g1_i1.p1 TRINITY_DN12284_c0_g1~~TRINITY_DN12284_c0_g1_i1.p1  ORF type:complete len:322 (+),score=32.53 TRINITY_DN12284_c0_g1_i1:63-1028(+)